MHLAYSRNAEADRRFFRDTLKFPYVDAGGGWLTFALTPAELAVHPAEENGLQEIFLMCKDLKAKISAPRRKRVKVSTPSKHEGNDC
jgi:hypothetical protein